jgi:CBS domain-containing protein
MATVEDILKRKGSAVRTIRQDASVFAAACAMNEARIGALVVCDGETVVGIFTERDVLVRVIGRRCDPDKTTVGEVMSSPVRYCTLDTALEDCRELITARRIRHLPVMTTGLLVGIITSGDILAFESAEREETIASLVQYIHGPAVNAAGEHGVLRIRT